MTAILLSCLFFSLLAVRSIYNFAGAQDRNVTSTCHPELCVTLRSSTLTSVKASVISCNFLSLLSGMHLDEERKG
jgi:hypothetical protein